MSERLWTLDPGWCYAGILVTADCANSVIGKTFIGKNPKFFIS